MRLATVATETGTTLALETPDGLVDAALVDKRVADTASIDDLFDAGSAAWQALEDAAADGAADAAPLTSDDLRFLPPVLRPGKVIAIGLNYWDHCREQDVEPPEHPLVFAKFPTSLVGHEADIRWDPNLTTQVDWEAELAVVIGRRARQVAADEALSRVAGYACANDVSARDLQFGDKQWVRGKSLDTFCPLGPWLVTPASVPDPGALRIASRVNGASMQDSNTSEMIVDVAGLVAFTSQAFTLEPGDVILTGTPDGVGVFRDPPVFLGDGDEVEIEIDGLGTLRNRCAVDAA